MPEVSMRWASRHGSDSVRDVDTQVTNLQRSSYGLQADRIELLADGVPVRIYDAAIAHAVVGAVVCKECGMRSYWHNPDCPLLPSY